MLIGSAFFPLRSPSRNTSVRWIFLASVRFFLVTIADFRAHPISTAGPLSSDDIYTSSSTISGTVPATCSSLAAYNVIALSYSVSCLGHTCVCHSPAVSLRTRNAAGTWYTLRWTMKQPNSFFTGLVVITVILSFWNLCQLFCLFFASSSFEGLKRNLANRIICMLFLTKKEGHCFVDRNYSKVNSI